MPPGAATPQQAALHTTHPSISTATPPAATAAAYPAVSATGGTIRRRQPHHPQLPQIQQRSKQPQLQHQLQLAWRSRLEVVVVAVRQQLVLVAVKR